jgi:nucleotide-binding universal stress UspA family protein
MKIMVAYDGTIQSKEALKYGMKKAGEKGGEVIALYVFNRPQFVDYDATIGAQSAARREAAQFMEEAKKIMREHGKGVKSGLYSTDGNPEESVISFAKAEKIDLLLCPPHYKAIIRKYRASVAEHALAAEAAAMNISAVAVTK